MENNYLQEMLEKMKNGEKLTQNDIKTIIDNSNIYEDNIWIVIIVLLFAINPLNKGDDKQCTETIMDTIIPQEI